MRRPFKILVKRVDNLGDVIFILPILKSLRLFYPHAQLILMVKKEHRSILYNYANSFLPPRTDRWVKGHVADFDKVVNIAYEIPRDYQPSAIIKKKYIHIGIKKFKGPRPVYHKLLLNLKAHGMGVSYIPPKVFLNPIHEKQVEQWGKKSGLLSKQLSITIDPGSNFVGKCWPLSYFTELCKWIINHFNAHLFILGAQNDKRIKALCMHLQISTYTLVTGKPIGFVAALMAKCHLHVGNDSGLGHVAAALNIPTVTIFGPTAPHLWRPAGMKAMTVYNPDIECEGGYEHAATCKLQKCLFSVKPKAVADAVVVSMNLHIRKTYGSIIDGIKISKNFAVRRRSKGMLLTNARSGHSCLVIRGWDVVQELINEIKRTGSYSKTLKIFPKEKMLMDMLLVHRIVVPVSSKEKVPFL